MEIIMKFAMMLVVVAVCATIAFIVDSVRKGKIDKEMGRISFRESMDLVQLPIVTFRNNGIKLNFLLDTGASYSSINEAALEGLLFEETGEVGGHYGIEGTLLESRYVKMNVSYKTKDYEDEFQVVDLSQAFDNIKSEFGINLHGILSNTFFQKYKYVLDFNELIAYSRV